LCSRITLVCAVGETIDCS